MNWQGFFEDHGARNANIGLTSTRPNVSVEEMYQAFAARFRDENEIRVSVEGSAYQHLKIRENQ